MNYYIEVKGNDKNTADTKAPADMCRILRQRGYQAIRFRPITGKPKPFFQLTQLANWTRVALNVGNKDLLLYQYPLDLFRVGILLLKVLMRVKQMTVVLLIHDLDSLRGYYFAEENARREKLLKQADYLICHNDRMKEWLVENGIPADRIVPMGAFDYLFEGGMAEREDWHSVIIAGNLGKRKSPYISRYLSMEKDYQVNLFGPYFEDSKAYQHYRYFGSFPPEELPHNLKGGFGLVWDGDTTDECSGLTGQYLRFNNPHKAFLYIASGIPVIVWDQAAIAEYICKKGLGFTVTSLHEISQKLQEMSREDYLAFCRHTEAEGKKLRSGYYLNHALDEIEKKCGKHSASGRREESAFNETGDRISQKKEILVLFFRMEMGGSEIALLAFLKALIQDGHSVTLLLTEKRGPTLDRIPKEVTVEELRFDSDVLAKLSGNRILGARFFWPKMVMARLLRVFYSQDRGRNNLFPFLLKRVPEREKQYDVLFDYYGYGEFLTAYGAEKVHADKKAIWFHDEDIQKFWGNGRVNEYLGRYQKLYCVSSAVKNALDDSYPEFADKTEVLLNFIDTDEMIQKAKAPYPSERFTGSFKILTVGRLTEQKGIDLAIKTAARLKKEGMDFQWYVIGEGNLYPELSACIQKDGVGSVFHLMGKQENPYPYYKDCDLYVQPSRHEGYSIALIEAKALCRPIIASDIPSNREQITDGVNGVLAELDENDLAEKILTLWRHPEKRIQLTETLKKEKPDFQSEYRKLQAFMYSPT